MSQHTETARNHSTVAIVGAGPVGLTIATALKLHGIEVRLIERNHSYTPYSKAIGVHARTLEAMHALGITEHLIADGHPLHAFGLVDNGRTILAAGFDSIDSPYNFVLGLPQSRTERRLLERFIALGGTVEWRTTLVGIDADVDNERVCFRTRDEAGEEHCLSTNWLIGADGGRSSVREFAGIEFPGGDYGNAFILGDVKIDWDGPRNDLQFFLSPHGYLLVVPMPDGMHRIIAQTQRTYDEFQRQDRPVATLDELQSIVDTNGPGGIRVHSPQWLTCAPFYHREAVTPRKGRVLLAGDAFHLFSPLGAQGLNTGFQDAFNLSWKIAYVENGWADPALIDSYVIERQAMARRIAALTARTTRFITEVRPLRRRLRHWLTRAYNRTAVVQHMLPTQLAGLQQAYGSDSPLSGPSAPGLPPAGARIPHAWLPLGAGYQPLAALTHSCFFTLFVIGDRLDTNALRSLRELVIQAATVKLQFLRLVVVAREITAVDADELQSIEILEDRLGGLSLALGRPTRAMILARPDGYCALSTSSWRFEVVEHYFARNGLRHAPPHDVVKEAENSYA